MKSIADLIKEHTFFSGLTPEDLEFIAGCGKNVVFKAGQEVAHRGDPAKEFYLIRSGLVDLAIDVPPTPPVVFQTLGENSIVGLSWLIPPYKWTLTATVKEDVHAIALDGECLRNKCEKEPVFGFRVMKHLVQLLLKREEALRLHLLNVYG